MAGIEYATYPKARLKDEASNIQASFQEFGVYANYPIALKNKKTIIINGFAYGIVQANSYNDALVKQTTEDFHKISYNFMIVHKLNDKWSFVGRLAPTLASDFNSKLNNDDFIMQASVAVNKRINENTLIGAGIAYTTRLGKPLILPAFQLLHEKNRQQLKVVLPAGIDYAYKPGNTSKWLIGARLGLNGANFNVSANDVPAITEPDRLNYFRANIGPVVSYKITKLLQVEAFGGLSMLRRYQYEDIKDNTYQYDSKSSGFFNIGLAIIPPKPKSIQQNTIQ